MWPKILIRNSFFIFILNTVITTYADTPPDPGGGPGSGDVPVGGGAPLYGGFEILLIFALAYIFWKLRLGLIKKEV